MREVPNEPFRSFLVDLDAREAMGRYPRRPDAKLLSASTAIRRIAEEGSRSRRGAKRRGTKKAAEIAAYQQRLKEAGITPEGLVELIDASERFDPAPIAAKLAEIDVEGRHLRVYETSDPNLLLVKEKKGPMPLDDYAIERDEGLVADLKLFAQAP